MASSVGYRVVGFVIILIGIVSLLTSFQPSSHHNQTPLSRPNVEYPTHNATSSDPSSFLLGAGRADITGPVVEINMMGYADPKQSGTGLRQRLYCRAFIIASPSNTKERIAYLVLDTQSGDTAVRHGILEGLKALGEEFDMYNKDNIAVTGTHSHSGPGAWLNYLLPQITSKGFNKDSYRAIVDGSVLAIRRAHASLTPGRLSLGTAETRDINVNRSPFAYLANPAKERDLFEHDVDKEMTVLFFENAVTNEPMGILSWLPVHGTSLLQNNTLITGDNKGVAAYLLEEHMKDRSSNFVAGFSQANVGDTTPNVLGAYCEDTGLPCRFNDSTCGGRTQLCRGRGPFFQYPDQGTKSCFEIGRRQFEAARDILASSNMKRIDLSTVSSFHIFANLSSYSFVSPFDASRLLQTCSAALGYGFAAGTTDGPGAFDFQQGTNDSDDAPALKNPLWRAARRFLHEPNDEQKQCQSPKPILLDVGATHSPYAWTPNIVDIQMMRIGSLVLIISPGEVTTMSGRRWRKHIADTASDVLNITDAHVLIGGPANTYGHYIATEEEYGVQRYEGASTLYGPHTLAAYVNLTSTYLPYLGSASEVGNLEPLSSGPQPPINVNKSLSFISPVVVDHSFFRSFGKALQSPDPSRTHKPGELVVARFVGANPRNDLHLEGTYAAVEFYDPVKSVWEEIRTDRDWSLAFHWERKSTTLGTSEVQIEWEVDVDHKSQPQQRGLYRIKYYGDWRSITGSITPFAGASGTFYAGSIPTSGEMQSPGDLARN